MMRIIIPNKKPVDETRSIVERSMDDLFRSAAGGVVQISNIQKSWSGNVMSFSFDAGVVFITTPIHGTVAVTESEVTIDVIIPEVLRRFIPEETLKTGVESRIRGLIQ